MLEIETKNKLQVARPFIGSDGRNYVSVLKKGCDPKKPQSYTTQPIQANATLRPEDWKELDDVIIRTVQNELIGINDLRANGLTYGINNALATMTLESHTINDSMEAILSMNGLVRGQNDRPTFDKQGIPLPLVHTDYQIETRTLEASKKSGTPLDTESAQLAARALSEKLENMLFQPFSYKYENSYIYSYVSYPDRNQLTLGTSWTTASHAQIIADVLNMKAQLSDLNFHANKMIYVPADVQPRFDEFYHKKEQITLLDRIKQISGIVNVKATPYLDNDNIVMVQLTSDVVRLIDGLPITNVQDIGEGGFLNSYKIYTIQVPEIRSDINGNTGLVHLA